MPESPPRWHTLAGLDDWDLALVAAACAHQASFLAHLAAGHYDDQVASAAGYHPDRAAAAKDAERLQFIADALDDRLE